MSITKNAPLSTLVELLYGGLPPTPPPGTLQARLLHEARPPAWPGARLQTWRWTLAGAPGLGGVLQVLLPATDGLVPVLLWGDACWTYLDDAVRAQAMDRGLALAWFNRTELADDGPQCLRAGPVFEAYPQAPFGALAAWAWGLSRAADLLQEVAGLDTRRLGVLGHSRGGKAALIAGACDPRFALVAAHNSGVGGAASAWHRGQGSEGLDDLARAFPHWLGRDTASLLPELESRRLDQDLLLAAVAPRRLLVLQSDGDAWANPSGTGLMVERASQAWPAAAGPTLVRRLGGHAMGPDDWRHVFDAMQALPA